MQASFETHGVLVTSTSPAMLVPVSRPHESDTPALSPDLPVTAVSGDDLAAIQAGAGTADDGTLRGTFSVKGGKVALVQPWGHDHRDSRIARRAAAKASGQRHPLPSGPYGVLTRWGEEIHFTPLVEDERGLRAAAEGFPVTLSTGAAWRVIKAGLVAPDADPASSIAGFFVLTHTPTGDVSVKEAKDVWKANRLEVEAAVRDHLGWEGRELTASDLHKAVADGDDETVDALNAILCTGGNAPLPAP